MPLKQNPYESPDDGKPLPSREETRDRGTKVLALGAGLSLLLTWAGFSIWNNLTSNKKPGDAQQDTDPKIPPLEKPEEAAS